MLVVACMMAAVGKRHHFQLNMCIHPFPCWSRRGALLPHRPPFCFGLLRTLVPE